MTESAKSPEQLRAETESLKAEVERLQKLARIEPHTGLFSRRAYDEDREIGWLGFLEIEIFDLNDLVNEVGRTQADAGLMPAIGAAFQKVQGDGSAIRIYSRYWPEMFAVRFVDAGQADSIVEALAQGLKAALETLEVKNAKGETHDQTKIRSLRVRHNHLN